MTKREKQILELIKQNPLIQQKELARQLGIQRSSIAVHIASLIRKGQIKGRGYLINEADHVVVVVGGANVDIAGFPHNKLVGADSNPGAIRISAGGVGRNIAAALSQLGIQTQLISVVGDDLFGRQIIQSCRETGIETSLIKTVVGAPSSVYMFILNHQGDMELAVNDMDILEHLDVDALKQSHSTLSTAAAIVVDTNLSETCLRYLADTYPDRLFLDTVSTLKAEKVKAFIHAFSLIKPNRQEAEVLLDMKIRTLSDARRAVARFLQMGVRTAVISMGKQGVVFGNKDLIDAFKPQRAAGVNATGAGDAFMAALVYGHLQGLELRESIHTATAAAYLTLSNENTTNPDLSPEAIQQARKELTV